MADSHTATKIHQRVLNKDLGCTDRARVSSEIRTMGLGEGRDCWAGRMGLLGSEDHGLGSLSEAQGLFDLRD